MAKIIKVQGEFPWHYHEEEELFYKIEGTLAIRTREMEIILHKDEFIVIPHGIQHSPMSLEEIFVTPYEPKTILNMRNLQNQYTQSEVQWI